MSADDKLQSNEVLQILPSIVDWNVTSKNVL